MTSCGTLYGIGLEIRGIFCPGQPGHSIRNRLMANESGCRNGDLAAEAGSRGIGRDLGTTARRLRVAPKVDHPATEIFADPSSHPVSVRRANVRQNEGLVAIRGRSKVCHGESERLYVAAVGW